MRNIFEIEDLSRKKTGNYGSCQFRDDWADKKDVETK